LIFFVAQATKEMINLTGARVPTVAVTYVILLLLLSMVVFAHPQFRKAHQDQFELIHRFCGWTATALVWVQVVLLTDDFKAPHTALSAALVRSVPLWMVAVMTGSIILPWIRLRKVDVRAEVLSDHAVRLYFDYTTALPGSFTRISISPLMEWHSFAAIRVPNSKGYSLIVSDSGDWSSKCIADPPKKLWVRGIPIRRHEDLPSIQASRHCHHWERYSSMCAPHYGQESTYALALDLT
jgi:hypothetical protein